MCHAWAPATLLFDNPSPIVVKRSDGLEIPFGSSDVKALLVYFMDRNYSKSYFVSRRCDVDDAKLKKQVEKGEITLDEYTRTMESGHCRGINPGAFHIILGNMIGLKDKGFIADVTRDLEVWNQAVSGYRSKILMTRLDNFSKEADPRTIKEVKIETIMEYTVETPFTWKKDLMNNSTETIKYTYWLELDQNRNIIGGTWISHDRPDFLWNRDRPQFKGAFKFSSKKRAVLEFLGVIEVTAFSSIKTSITFVFPLVAAK